MQAQPEPARAQNTPTAWPVMVLAYNEERHKRPEVHLVTGASQFLVG